MKEKQRIIEWRGAHSAATFIAEAETVRERQKETFVDADIENAIGQAVWKVFDDNRQSAAAQLCIPDVDVVLGSAAIMEVRIDGNRVIDPLGFTGKRFSATVAVTALPKSNGAAGREVFEVGVVEALLLARSLNTTRLAFVVVDDEETALYRVSGDEVRFIGSFPWGKRTIEEAYADALGVPDHPRDVLYDMYREGTTSPHVAKKMDAVFESIFSVFLDGLGGYEAPFFGMSEKGKHAFHIVAPFLPSRVYDRKFEAGKMTVSFVPATVPPLSTFIEERIRGPYTKLDRLARRRARWFANA